MLFFNIVVEPSMVENLLQNVINNTNQSQLLVFITQSKFQGLNLQHQLFTNLKQN